MTLRDSQIVKAILDEMHDLDAGQTTESLMHAGVNLRLTAPASLMEFNAALNICDTRGWLTGVQSKFTGRKWNINDAGEAARLEIK